MANSGKISGRHGVVATCSTSTTNRHHQSFAQPATIGRCCTLDMERMLEKLMSHHQLQPFIHNCAERLQLRTERRLPVIRALVRHDEGAYFFLQTSLFALG